MHAAGEQVVPILPPREPEGPIVQTPLRLPKPVLDRIDQIAQEEDYSRNEVLVHFVKWALAEYEREKAGEENRVRPIGNGNKKK